MAPFWHPKSVPRYSLHSSTSISHVGPWKQSKAIITATWAWNSEITMPHVEEDLYASTNLQILHQMYPNLSAQSYVQVWTSLLFTVHNAWIKYRKGSYLPSNGTETLERVVRVDASATVFAGRRSAFICCQRCFDPCQFSLHRSNLKAPNLLWIPSVQKQLNLTLRRIWRFDAPPESAELLLLTFIPKCPPNQSKLI